MLTDWLTCPNCFCGKYKKNSTWKKNLIRSNSYWRGTHLSMTILMIPRNVLLESGSGLNLCCFLCWKYPFFNSNVLTYFHQRNGIWVENPNSNPTKQIVMYYSLSHQTEMFNTLKQCSKLSWSRHLIFLVCQLHRPCTTFTWVYKYRLAIKHSLITLMAVKCILLDFKLLRLTQVLISKKT